MINKIKIVEVAKNLLAKFRMVGSSKPLLNGFISPLGVYSKPKNKIGLSLDNNKYTLALHGKGMIPVALGDNDIIYTDGKNYIHYSNSDELITIKSNKKIIINSSDIEFNGNVLFNNNVKINRNVDILGAVKNKGIDISCSHKHKLGSVTTTPPLP